MHLLVCVHVHNSILKTTANTHSLQICAMSLTGLHWLTWHVPSPGVSPTVQLRATQFISESASHLAYMYLFDSPEYVAIFECPVSTKSTPQFYSGFYKF